MQQIQTRRKLVECVWARIAVLVILAVLGRQASAQQEVEPSANLTLEPVPVEVDSIPELLPRDWRVQIEPSLWRPGLFGDIQAPGSSANTALEDINLDESGYGALVEAVFRIDKKSAFRLNAFIFEQSERAVAQAAFAFGSVSGVIGDAVSSKVNYSSLEFVYDWELWARVLPGIEASSSVTMKVNAYAGVRAYDIAFDMVANGGTIRADQQWIDGILGLRLETELTADVAFDISLDAGGMALGDLTSSSVNVLAGIHWRPNNRFGVQFGYKFLFTDVTDGDGAAAFEWAGSIAGVYLGVIWRF